MTSPSPQPIPAATVIIMRDAPEAPELLMVERSAALAFAGGALVFPGGRVDPGDRMLAEAFSGEADEMAHRIAAFRETLEETGIALGVSDRAAAAELARNRAALNDGAAFADLLQAAGAALTPDALVPFARWRPDHLGRIFDTRFYLARLPEEAPEPTPDIGENVRSFWMRARDVLGEADAGRATVIYPTRRNLERLATFASYDEAVAHARSHPVRTITPWVERRDDAEHLCIPGDCGYPVTSERLDRAQRA